MEAFHRWVAFPVPEDLLCQVERPEGPVEVPGVDLVEVAAVAYLVAGMGLPGVPDRD